MDPSEMEVQADQMRKESYDMDFNAKEIQNQADQMRRDADDMEREAADLRKQQESAAELEEAA